MSKTNVLEIKCNKNSYYIKFYPGIKSAVGCEKATLILGRLEYWFERYTSGFYKFVEPCQHPLYREGDSWSEEIGFSRKIFAKAFDLIGVRYKSKSAFMRSKDKFQGKLYASYHDRKTNQTYFIRNNQFASEFINGLFCRKSAASASKQKKVEDQKISSIDTKSPAKKGRSRNSSLGRSFGGTIGGKVNKPIQRNTSSLESVKSRHSSSMPSEPLYKQVTEEMIKVWEEEVGDLGITKPSDRFSEKLFDSLKNFFDQSIESWKDYCRLISSSKFLMGEAQNKFFKKAWITWAIREESIEKIRGGGFKLGDRETRLETQAKTHRNTLTLLENKKEDLEERIENIKTTISRERLKTTRETIKALSDDELTSLREEFEKTLNLENNAITEEFKRCGWKGTGIETYFSFFLEEKIGNILFTSSLEEAAIQAVESSGLLPLLQDIIFEINTLKQKRFDYNEGNKNGVAKRFHPMTLAAA